MSGGGPRGDGDLAEAEAFYAEALGFAVTARADGVVFFGADGYHHHVAVNVWSAAGAGARPDSLGLGVVTVQVASTAELDALETRLTERGIDHERTVDAIAVDDPWGSRIDVIVVP